MDAVVEWMFAGSPREGKAQFEQALLHGIDSLSSPAKPLQDFFRLVERDPDWLDRDLLDKGVKANHLGGDADFYVLRDFALMGGYVYFSSMNQTLSQAGSLQKDTSQRLGETGKWMFDVTEPNGLSRFGPGFISTLRVRLIHALIRRHLGRQPDWNLQRWGLPINQVDMQATYLAFGPVTLTGSRLFGVPVRRDDANAVMHLWRYTGWLMGGEEERLARSEGEGLRKLYHTFLTHQLPDDKVRQLGMALASEPLLRNLPDTRLPRSLQYLLRRYHHARHLSNSALILGPVQRRRLGLPLYILPWYPLLSAPKRLFTIMFYRLLGESALDRLRQRQRLQRSRLLDTYFGDKKKTLLEPGADHPAHVK